MEDDVTLESLPSGPGRRSQSGSELRAYSSSGSDFWVEKAVSVLPGVRPYTLYKYFGKPSGAQCYMPCTPLRRTSCCASSQRITLPVDDFMDQEWRHGVAAIGIEPMPISMLDLPSDIGQRRPEHPSVA